MHYSARKTFATASFELHLLVVEFHLVIKASFHNKEVVTGGVLPRDWDLAPKHSHQSPQINAFRKNNQFKGEIVESEKHRWQQSQYNNEFFISCTDEKEK